MDQPLADPSCIALYFVSKLASEYVKVVLSGEGADELFGGYTDLQRSQGIPLCTRRLIPRLCPPWAWQAG